jgi:crotonobetainyl-CoA:carnitine CoA-transferase CaiB-like acyl-CoA transferase
VPAGPVNSVEEAFAQPHAVHRQMTVARDGYRGIGLPIRLHDTPGAPGKNPSPFNADAAQVLRQAGYTQEEVEQFFAGKVISAKDVRHG